MNIASMLAGFIAALATAAFGLMGIMSLGQGLASGWLTVFVFGTAIAAMACAAVVRLAVLALLARIIRGADALAWCWPSECQTVGAWLGSSWNFNSSEGRQEGLRVFGVGIALQGTHGRETQDDPAGSARNS